MEKLPPKLQDIAEMFQDAQGTEKLEILLELAMELPELPSHLQDKVAKMEQVTECQTPFFLASEINDGKMIFYYDAPIGSPTIRGFASILAQGAVGISPQEVLHLPTDLHTYLGLEQVLSPLRLRGMYAVLGRMKNHAKRYLV